MLLCFSVSYLIHQLCVASVPRVNVDKEAVAFPVTFLLLNKLERGKNKQGMFSSLKPVLEIVPSNQSPVHDLPEGEVEKLDINSR